MHNIARVLILAIPFAACSSRGGGNRTQGAAETATAAPPVDAAAEPGRGDEGSPSPPPGAAATSLRSVGAGHAAGRTTMERPASGTRWENGYLLAPDSPDPLACDTEADCVCAMLVAEDGCCQPSIWPFPQTRAYAEWLRRHLASDACRTVECPPGLPPSPPLPCQSKPRCFDGLCSTACPWMPQSAFATLAIAEIDAVRQAGGLQVSCRATFRNLTSEPIGVRTNFSSVFDGLNVVVSAADGTELKRQAYVHHQSPQAPDGVPLELPVGETTQRLLFPLETFPAGISGVRVRLEGGLPGVAGSVGLRSEDVDVTIGERSGD
jgi:hypothetical protein